MNDRASIRVFLSIVTDEFGSHRELLTEALHRFGADVKVQENFHNPGKTTLELLHDYIRDCDAVIHLIGDATGSIPEPAAVAKVQECLDLEKLFKDLPFLPNPLAEAQISYTQWEAYLALYYGRRLFVYRPTEGAPRDEKFVLNAVEKARQDEHFQHLCDLGHGRDEFRDKEELSRKVLADLHQEHILPEQECEVMVEPTKLRHTAERLIGREGALQRLDEAWASASTNVVVIRAWGGVGKTSLVAAWMAEMATKGWRGARRVFDWSFYSQGTRQGEDADKAASADLFIAKALEFFGDPDPQQGSPWERGKRLAKLVAETKSLLVLDGLEPLQEPPGQYSPGKIKDDAIAALFKGLAANNSGLCVATTREYVPELNSFYDNTAIEWSLEHLSEEAGAQLLHITGVNRAGDGAINADDEELKQASREVGGHALTLQLMARYLVLAHRGDVRKRDVFNFTEAQAEFKTTAEDAYGHAFKVMAAYETWLAAGGESGQSQLAILRLLGFFDRPADPGSLAALCAEPPLAGLTDALAGINDAQWNIAVKRLEEIGLVTPAEFAAPTVWGHSEDNVRPSLSFGMTLGEPEEFSPSPALREDALEAHPLLREYFAGQLREGREHAWREGHRRLYEHLKQRVPYWPEGLIGLQPLYQAVSHGCLAGLHAQACADVYRGRILRGTGTGGFYSSKNLGAIGADLGAVACFFEQPWTQLSPNLSESDQAWLLNEAATRLCALGRLTEAVVPMRAGLQMRIKQEQWKQAAISASNLSELGLTLGDIAAAVGHGEQSVTLAEYSGDEPWKMISRTTHAHAQHQAGMRDEALALFRDAEAMQAKEQPAYPRLYSLRGYQYCDLLLSYAERAAWRITMECGDLSSNPDLRQPADQPADSSHTESGDWSQHSGAMTACHDAAQRAAQTLQWSAQDNNLLDIALDHLTLGRAALYQALLARAAFHLSQSAIDHLTAAVDGLRASGQMDVLPRGLLTRAWPRRLQKDTVGARADLNEAWEIAERGSMWLHMADIQLHRARLFRDRAALSEARELIDQCGYHRRDEELADAEAAAENWG